MSMIAVAAGPALVGLLLLVLTGQWNARRESSGLILALAPLAFLSITIPLFLGTWRFIAGFEQLAQEGKGGAPVVAPLCLAIAQPLLLGTIAALVSIVATAAFQAFLRRARSDQDHVEGQRSSSWFACLLLGASSGLVLPVGALIYVAREVARLTMLVVDPAKKEAAEAALAGMDLSQVSGVIASRSTAVLISSFALSAVLLASGIVGVLVALSNKGRRPPLVYSWWFLLVVTLAASWGIFQLQSDVSWFNRAGRAAPPSAAPASPSEHR